MTVLDQQFKQRLGLQTDIEVVLTVADYVRELGVDIPLTGENFEVLKSYVEQFNIGEEDIFADVEARISRLQSAAPALLRYCENPLSFLVAPCLGMIDEKDLKTIQDLGQLDSFSELLLGSLISKSNRVIKAYMAAALDGSTDKLKEMLQEDGIFAELYRHDSLELTWVKAVEEAVDYCNTQPLAEILEPDVDPVLARYYVSYPGSDQRHVVDAALNALFKRDPEDLKALLKRSGFTISRLPKAKTK